MAARTAPWTVSPWLSEVDAPAPPRDGPGCALWQRRRIPLPPEPLRWGIAKALIGLFSWMDRRVDLG
jgi:hypothetical protein